MLFNDKSVAVKAAIEALETWAVSGAPLTNVGICSNLDSAIYCEDIYWCFVVECAARSWPHYSGSLAYPVPLHGRLPKAAFEEEALWEGVYGELRRDLCKHIANYLKEGLHTHIKEPRPGQKVWCSIEGVRKEGEVLRVFEDARYNYRFRASCNGVQYSIDAHTINKEWGFIE